MRNCRKVVRDLRILGCSLQRRKRVASKKIAEQEKPDEKRWLSMKNPKKDMMKVVEEKERITNLLKEAKNFPGDKEAQVKVSE